MKKNTGRNLLIAAGICLLAGIACIMVGMELLSAVELAKRNKQPQQRRQPYVVLNTEEKINAGDTLYVLTAGVDTMVLWGK